MELLFGYVCVLVFVNRWSWESSISHLLRTIGPSVAGPMLSKAVHLFTVDLDPRVLCMQMHVQCELSRPLQAYVTAWGV